MAVQTEDKKLNGAGLTTLWGIIKQFFSSKQDKVSALGSATKPVYISGDGTFGECDSYKDSTAKNIVGEFSDTGAEFAYRPSAGAVDIESGKADFGGHLETIKGNTVAWNQICTDGHTEKTFSNSETIGSYDFGINTISGHKYLLRFEYSLLSIPSVANFRFWVSNQNWGIGYGITTNGVAEGIFNCEVNNNVGNLYLSAAETPQGGSVKNLVIIDLTLIYGAGNEPTTPEAFEADYMKWFGKPLTYEEYDEGSLRSVEMTGLKTVGFNQWDEEWEKGTFDSKGEKMSFDAVRSKNIIPVVKGERYFVKQPNSYYGIWFYDSNKSFISNSIINRNSSFGIPVNCRYINFATHVDYGTTYNHDICINLHHSGDKDGQYEPYWESVLNVPITSLKGKLNGTRSSVVVFPDGMKKAGSVYDEIVRRGDKTYAIKRVGSVDLGSLNWKKNETSVVYFESSHINNLTLSDNTNIESNILTSIFNVVPQNSFTSIDNCIIKQCFSAKDFVDVHSTGYASLSDAAFKAAMNGVMLYYELETPEEYLLDDFELPQSYDVDDWGTEEILLGENGCAPILDLKYGINAGDTIKNLPHNYVSAVGEQNFTEAQKARARQNIGAASQWDIAHVQKQIDALSKITQGDYWVDMGLPSGILWAKRNIDLSQANGFAASEYQYEGSFFSWGNTDGHNPTSTTSFGEYSFGTNIDSEPYVSSEGAALTGDITPSFDAARVNLGTPWRMPTSDDFAELFNSAYTKFIDASGNDIDSATANKLITINGVVGIRLKSIVNGNIIFFACSGYGDGTSWSTRGSGGSYWASSLTSSTYGRHLGFHGSGVYPQGNVYRYIGFAIRPVM